jgi:acyl dehydratase
MELKLGSVIEFQSCAAISREQLKAYAEASGDFNPIHLDEEVALKAGLPGIIAHGMLIAALIAERAEKFVAQEVELANGGFQLSQFQTRFKAMTLLGDTPSIGGTVKKVSDEGFALELLAKNQRGEITTVGNVSYRRKIENV